MTIPADKESTAKGLKIGLLVYLFSLFAIFLNTSAFFRAYLFAWLFWCGMGLGGFGLLMLHHLVGGRWGFPVRRFFEAAIRTIPFVAIGFIPLLFGLHDLYHWASPAAIQSSEVLQRKQVYLNLPFFIIRIIAYFAIWLWMMHTLSLWSRKQDGTKDPEPTRRLRTFSGPGICLFFLTATFANIDYILSLEAEWYSTIFPAIVIIGNAVAMLALSIVLLASRRNERSYSSWLSPDVWHHLGNLLLAFVMLWAYLVFSQLLVIYSGNLPHEIVWYLHRSQGGWKVVALLLGLLHFAVPFALLLSRQNKRKELILVRIAILVIIAHILDLYWLVIPSFSPDAVRLHWQEVLLFLSMGAVWVPAFLNNFASEPPIPLNDPRVPRAIPI